MLISWSSHLLQSPLLQLISPRNSYSSGTISVSTKQRPKIDQLFSCRPRRRRLDLVGGSLGARQQLPTAGRHLGDEGPGELNDEVEAADTGREKFVDDLLGCLRISKRCTHGRYRLSYRVYQIPVFVKIIFIFAIALSLRTREQGDTPLLELEDVESNLLSSSSKIL